MEFQFNINEFFKQPIVEIDNNLLPSGFVGDRRTIWDIMGKVTQVINSMGEASARAQGLPKPVTTTDRLRASDNKLYLMIDSNANNGNGAVTGMLKTGKKGLYVFDREGQYYQVSPKCVLDFYVPESRQRSGYGKTLFEHMLGREQIHPVNMAVDRPSDKLINFLSKHYKLKDPLRQKNNFVVYSGFFPKSNEDQSNKVRYNKTANGLQYFSTIQEPATVYKMEEQKEANVTESAPVRNTQELPPELVTQSMPNMTYQQQSYVNPNQQNLQQYQNFPDQMQSLPNLTYPVQQPQYVNYYPQIPPNYYPPQSLPNMQQFYNNPQQMVQEKLYPSTQAYQGNPVIQSVSQPVTLMERNQQIPAATTHSQPNMQMMQNQGFNVPQQQTLQNQSVSQPVMQIESNQGHQQIAAAATHSQPNMQVMQNQGFNVAQQQIPSQTLQNQGHQQISAAATHSQPNMQILQNQGLNVPQQQIVSDSVPSQMLQNQGFNVPQQQIAATAIPSQMLQNPGLNLPQHQMPIMQLVQNPGLNVPQQQMPNTQMIQNPGLNVPQQQMPNMQMLQNPGLIVPQQQVTAAAIPSQMLQNQQHINLQPNMQLPHQLIPTTINSQPNMQMLQNNQYVPQQANYEVIQTQNNLPEPQTELENPVPQQSAKEEIQQQQQEEPIAATNNPAAGDSNEEKPEADPPQQNVNTETSPQIKKKVVKTDGIDRVPKRVFMPNDMGKGNSSVHDLGLRYGYPAQIPAK